jgi:hypothetical protein
MIIKVSDWAWIQRRLINAGLDRVPNGKIADSVLKSDGLYFIIDFDTEQDEIWFMLRWL